MLFLIFLAILTFLMVLVNFVYYLIRGSKKSNDVWFMTVEISVVLFMPLAFLQMLDVNLINDCCNGSAVFSPEHSIGIYAIIIVYSIAYVVTIFRERILAPLVEVFLNMMLVLGVLLNILLCIHLNTEDWSGALWFFGNVPILLLLFMKLHQNHKMLLAHIATNELEVYGYMGTFAMRLLQMNQAIKYPILVVLLVPLLILFSLFLLLFGQKPDSLIRAFTDTYQHGFSELDHECYNVECGGHFLCSVGANGDKSIVKPIRYGERNGAKIICNRQLLVSNAFEELVQEKLPKTHKFIRRNYNKVGDVVHKYYGVFNSKWVSNGVYILMKPLEWGFLIVLYCFDKNPENRIARQYISAEHRKFLARLVLKE